MLPTNVCFSCLHHLNTSRGKIFFKPIYNLYFSKIATCIQINHYNKGAGEIK